MSSSTAKKPPAHAAAAPAVSTIQPPPHTLGGIIRRLGPGLIIAGSIVGSGELIATTKTGAQAGMSLLWLIVVGCVIKVFAQIELGRHAITHGQTTLAALDSVPGPRWRVNWIVWFWFIMSVATFAQLGGIVGGVGQAMAIAMPLTGDYRQAIRQPSEADLRHYMLWKTRLPAEEERLAALPEAQRAEKQGELNRIRNHQAFIESMFERSGSRDALIAVQRLIDADEEKSRVARAGTESLQFASERQKEARQEVDRLLSPPTWDDGIWALAVTVLTIGLLYRGRYGVVEWSSTALVAIFTCITVGNVLALETQDRFRLTFDDLLHGFSLPAGDKGLFTALATFGIIGVGASELVSYPYWCLEKGYARFTGPRNDRAAWAERARGWMRVMHYDTFLSLIVYTTATLAFYLMGVAVLHRSALDPDGMRMVSTLTEQYRPVFGAYAEWLFLVGAFAVLYSTFLVASASYSRTFTDCFKLLGIVPRDNPVAHRRSVSTICVIVPLIALGFFCSGVNPVTLVFIGATMQALMLPVLGMAALYFRYRQSDERIRPSRLFDVCLIVSCLGTLVSGGWVAIEGFSKYLK